MKPRWITWTLLAGALAAAGVACAQDYPTKPIRLITAGTGGGNDIAARIIAPVFSARVGQQLIVDNRGGSVVIAAGPVMNAAPDGYTLLLYSGTLWILPLMEKAPYDPVKDFAPITLMVNSPGMLVVHPSLPVKSVRDLVALAKARPGQLNYANAAIGSSIHFASELFKSLAGVNIVGVPYKNAGPGISALMAGEVQVMIPNVGSVMSHVKSGRLRALGVTTAQPSALAPGYPTVAAEGVPGYEWATTFGIFAPAGTPAAIVNKLNKELVWTLHRPEVKERMLNGGIEVVGSTPEELAAAVKSEMARLTKVIKAADLRRE